MYFVDSDDLMSDFQNASLAREEMNKEQRITMKKKRKNYQAYRLGPLSKMRLTVCSTTALYGPSAGILISKSELQKKKKDEERREIELTTLAMSCLQLFLIVFFSTRATISFNSRLSTLEAKPCLRTMPLNRYSQDGTSRTK
jgi:hypothetical protein